MGIQSVGECAYTPPPPTICVVYYAIFMRTYLIWKGINSIFLRSLETEWVGGQEKITFKGGLDPGLILRLY